MTQKPAVVTTWAQQISHMLTHVCVIYVTLFSLQSLVQFAALLHWISQKFSSFHDQQIRHQQRAKRHTSIFLHPSVIYKLFSYLWTSPNWYVTNLSNLQICDQAQFCLLQNMSLSVYNNPLQDGWLNSWLLNLRYNSRHTSQINN